MGVTNPKSTENQVAIAKKILAQTPKNQRLFLFINISALHQPNYFYLRGATTDSIESHAAALSKFKDEIAALRQELPPHIYLWINAVKRELPYLSQEDRTFFESIDPLFHLNIHHYPSLGRACRAGKSVISVDGDGTMRRCHFIKEPIGNIYEPNFEIALFDRACTNQTCHCHIGYIHLEYLELDKVFGSGILERIPDNWAANRFSMFSVYQLI